MQTSRGLGPEGGGRGRRAFRGGGDRKRMFYQQPDARAMGRACGPGGRGGRTTVHHNLL